MIEPDAAAPAIGSPHIDAAVARLDGLEGLPVEDHVEVYEQIHVSLQDALQDAAGQEAVGPSR